MDNSDGLIRLLVGGIFVAFGVVAFVRREMKIGVGGGRGGTSPLFTIMVTGRGAIFLAATQILGGMVFGASFIFYWLGDLLSSEILFSVPSIGILIAFLGVVISPLLSSNSKEIRFSDESKHPLLQTNDAGDEAIVMVDKHHIGDNVKD